MVDGTLYTLLPTSDSFVHVLTCPPMTDLHVYLCVSISTSSVRLPFAQYPDRTHYVNVKIM